jgi:MFS family permease
LPTIRHFLAKSPPYLFVLYAGLAAFSTYSCMYAYRKSFSVGIFEGMSYWGLDYKSLLIIIQVFGYMVSKFVGIKAISEMRPERRKYAILGLIGTAQLALVAFAYTPAPYNMVCLFFNGLPLGMIWGLVFSYLEGRRTTEILGAMLSLSFILANNISKSLAQSLLQQGVSEFTMPYLVGLVFALPLLASVWLLDQVPPPSHDDEELRVKRVPMNGHQRWQSFQALATGLVLLIASHMLTTAYRDLQSNFASNIWAALGYAQVPSIYLSTSIPISLAVMVAMGLLYLIKDNLKALMAIQGLIMASMVLVGVSTWALEAGLISGVVWVVFTGIGTYLAYIPFNCFLFERTIAAFKIVGNAGFFMYLADSFGYLGSVGALLYKNLFEAQLDFYQFTIRSSYFVSIAGLLLSAAAMIYYLLKYKQAKSPHLAPQAV